MGNKLFGNFGVDIAKIINDNLAGAFLPATLNKFTAGTRTPGNLSGGIQPTSAPHSFRGMVDTYKDSQIDGTLVLEGDRKVLAIGDSLPSGIVPVPNDEIVIEGVTFKVIRVDRDPDAATYTCQVRG